MQNSIQKSVSTIFIQDPITTSNNFNKIMETGPSERALAQNLFNSQAYDEIKILFVERIVELGYDSAYQMLLTIRRLNQLFTGIIDQYLQGRLNVMYKPNDFPLEKFQILEHNNFFELPSCLRPNCFYANPDEWHFRKQGIQYKVNNNLIEASFELNKTLQEALILYFHAQRQLHMEPNNIICQSFVEIFESRLESFRSLCQNMGFQFFIDNRGVQRWLIMCMDNAIKNNIFVNLYCSYTAYLFAQFLHACVSSSFIFVILQKPWGAGYENRILFFFEEYNDYDLVSTILNNFIQACYSGLGFDNNPQIQCICLNYLNEMAQRGWLDKASVRNCNLLQTTLNFLSHNTKEFQISALNLLFALMEKDLVDKSNIEELKIREILEGKLLDTAIDIQGTTALIFLLLIDKEYIKDSSITYNDLIFKVMSAQKDLFEPFKKLASFTVIKEPLIKAINHYLTAAIVTMQLSELVSEEGILCQCAKNGLLEKSIVRLIIKEHKLADLLSHSEELMNVLSLKFFEYFKNLEYIDLSLIQEFNLIEKYIKAHCWHSGYCFFDPVDNKDLYFGDMLRDWVRQFPEIQKTIIEHLIEQLQNQEEGDSKIKRVLFRFLSDSVYNLSDPDYAANLIEQIVPFIATPNSLLAWGDDEYVEIIGRSAIRILRSVTEANLLNKSQFHDLQIIEKCFTKNDFTAGESDDAPLADTVEEFFEVLVERSLITRSELLAQSIRYLSHSDLIVKNNVLHFLQWRPIHPCGIQEFNRIGKMFAITDLSLAQANYYFRLRTRIAENKDLIDEISKHKFQIVQEIMHFITIEKDYTFSKNALKVFTALVNDNLMDVSLLNDLQVIEKTFLHFDFNSSIQIFYDDELDFDAELDFEILGDIVESFFQALIEKSLITQSELIHHSLQYLFHSEWKVKANVLRWLTGSTVDQACVKEALNLSQSLTEILPSAEFTKSTIWLLHRLIGKKLNEHLSDNLDIIVKCFTHCEAVNLFFINYHLDILVDKSHITRAQILIAIIKDLTSSELHVQAKALELFNHQLKITIDPFIKVLCTMLGSNFFENQISVVDLAKEYNEELSKILEIFQPHRHRFTLIIPNLGEFPNHRLEFKDIEEDRSLLGQVERFKM